MRPRVIVLGAFVLASSLGACADTFTPTPDGASLDGPPVDGSLYFDSAAEPFDLPDGFVIPDNPPPSSSNGRACRINNRDDCGPGAVCTAARIRRVGASTWRYASPGRCVDSTTTIIVPRCDLNGWVAAQRIGLTCMGFPGEASGVDGPAQITVRDCLRLREEALLQAGPGEEVSQCWFSDQTTATTPAYPIGGCASSEVPFLFGCGLGCDNCRAERSEVCMFVSPSYRTGVCLPRTNPLTQTALVCKTENPRLACPRGQACLLPVRNGRDGIPDRQRTGICDDPAHCRMIAGRHREGYLCDETLVQ